MALYPDEGRCILVRRWWIGITAGLSDRPRKAAGGHVHGGGKTVHAGIAFSGNDRGRTLDENTKTIPTARTSPPESRPQSRLVCADKKWVMALYLDKSDYALFSSPDLKRWQKVERCHIAR